LDTSALIDLESGPAPFRLPAVSLISAITLAELSYGVALARDPVESARRAQAYARVRTLFTPLAFGVAEADKYGELTALVAAAGRSPRPRRLDLMIAAVALANRLPLFTANPDDFAGLEQAVEVVMTR
jgi:predicted nucleic acid-binding protein